LAGVYLAAGRTTEAVALFERVRDACWKELGADRPQTLITLEGLADAYRVIGKTAEAIALLERVREARAKKLGADHPFTLATLARLALAYQAEGKPEQALPLLQQAAVGFEKRHFADSYAGPIVGALIDDYFERLKQYDQAEVWRRKWLAVVKERSGADTLPYATELALLGLTLLEQKKWTDAEAVLRNCLAIREKKQPDHWTTFNTRSMLGGALLGQKKYDEAQPLLRQGYEGMKAREKSIPPAATRLPEALDRLIELCTATNKPEGAAKWRAERARSDKATGSQPGEKK
jgi:tetratricopeptide (TPR) repeat protein